MDDSRFIKMININPALIENIENPTDEMKLLAIKKNGLMIRYIENPTKENLIKAENYLDKVDALGGELKVIIEYSRTRLKGLKLAKHPNTQCSQK